MGSYLALTETFDRDHCWISRWAINESKFIFVETVRSTSRFRHISSSAHWLLPGSSETTQSAGTINRESRMYASPAVKRMHMSLAKPVKSKVLTRRYLSNKSSVIEQKAD